MTRKTTAGLLIAAGFTAAAVGSAVSARICAPTGATVPGDAVAYHGAMLAYGRIARWAGDRALACEARYWEAVKQ